MGFGVGHRLKGLSPAVCLLVHFHLAAGVAVGGDQPAKVDENPFKPANLIYAGKMSFLDGTTVGGCVGLVSHLVEYPPGYVPAGDVTGGRRVYVARPPGIAIVTSRAVGKPGGRYYLPGECGPDKDGRFFLTIDYPGRYELRLESMHDDLYGENGFAGLLVASFEAKLDDNGVLAVDLPEKVTLPFDFYLVTAPGQKVELFNMGRQKSETLTADKDGVVVFAGPVAPGGPDRKNPMLPKHRVFKFFPAKSAKGERGVSNVDKQVHYWVEQTGSQQSGDQSFWIFSNNEKTKTIGISPFVIPKDLKELFAANNQTIRKPRLYLSEAGQVRVGFGVRLSNSSKSLHRNYALDDSLRLDPVDEPYWSHFTYRGMAINGGKWLIPNLGGIPALAEGSNTLRFECTLAWSDTKKARRLCAENFEALDRKRNENSQNYKPNFNMVPTVDMCRKDPECQCPPQTKGEQSINTSVSFELEWGPDGDGFDTAVLPPPNPIAHLEEALKPYRETYYSVGAGNCKTYLNGHGPLQVKVAGGGGMEDDTVGGGPCTGYIYDGDEEMLKQCLEWQKDRVVEEPEQSAGPSEYLSAVGDWRKSIDLLEGVEGKTGELINPSEGPYPTLRYHQVTAAGERTILDVCPQNYSWRTNAAEGIVIERSSMYGSACDSSVPPARPAVELTLLASAPGYRDFEPLRYFSEVDPATLVVAGTVRDMTGQPVPGATIKLPELDLSAQSDATGRYRISMSSDKTAVDWQADFALERVFKQIEATIETVEDEYVYANGRNGKLRLQVFADGEPYANRQVHIIQTGNFEAYGSPTELIQLVGSTFSGKLTTDASGRVEFAAPGPRVTPGRISPWSDPSGLFPMQGFFELRGEWDSLKKVMAPYDVHNPFPRISKTSMTHNVEEENWQIRPSRVWIEDPDSADHGGWRVTVSGHGHFKVLYGPVRRNELFESAPGSPFEFYYRAPKLGMNLQDQPDLWKDALATNMVALRNVYMSILENDVLKGQLFNKTNKVDVPGPKPGGRGKDGWSSKQFGKVSKYLGGASSNKVFNAVGGSDPRRGEQVLNLIKNGISALDRAVDTINMQESEADAGLTSEKVFANIDYALNMADSIGGALGLFSHNTGTEVAKLLWENSKMIYGWHKRHEEINNAILDEKPIPLTLTVEDELGHVTKKVVMVNTLIWTRND